MSSELEGNYLKDNHKVTWMDKKKQTIIQKIQNFNEKLRWIRINMKEIEISHANSRIWIYKLKSKGH